VFLICLVVFSIISVTTGKYRIIQIKTTKKIGILKREPTWWEKLLNVDIRILIPELLPDGSVNLDWSYVSPFLIEKSDFCESIVDDLSKIGELIIKWDKLKTRRDYINSFLNKEEKELAQFPSNVLDRSSGEYLKKSFLVGSTLPDC